MRVTQSYQTRVFAANNQSSLNKIAELQAQISNSKRVLDPADDPAASSKSLVLQQSLGQVTQYERNNTYAQSRLSMEESAIASLSDVVSSIRELALQANNDAMGDQDRQTLLQSVNMRSEELRSLANSRGPNGEYLFSGTDREVKPYPDSNTNQYDGNDSFQLVNIGFNNQISVGTSGNELLNYDVGGTDKSIFNTITDLQTTLATPVTVAARAAFHDDMGALLVELDMAQDQLNAYRANVGDRLGRIETARDNNGAVELMLREELETTDGLDYADAISRLQFEIQTLEAVQTTYSRIKDLSLFNYM
jgi:flagellar hook-associated protein 3 FlgL